MFCLIMSSEMRDLFGTVFTLVTGISYPIMVSSLMLLQIHQSLAYIHTLLTGVTVSFVPAFLVSFQVAAVGSGIFTLVTWI